MKKAFSLLEMLIVIAIIGALIAAAMMSYTGIVRKAQAAKCVELVSNAQTALVAALEREDAWPPAILAEGGSGNGQMTSEVGAALASRGLMNLSYRQVEVEEGVFRYELRGLDQCGVVSTWAAEVIKRRAANGSGANLSLSVPSGGTIEDHRLRFAVDDDYDGLVRVSGEGDGNQATVRASACVWCCGRDGKFGTPDDIRSWHKGQETN